jgi:hypothetical protein
MNSRRIVLSVAAVWLFSAPAHAAFLSGLSVQPLNPVAGDSVAITASGWLPDGCWDSSVSYDCARVGNAITITFQTVDRWVPGRFCVLLVQDFAGTCALGVLDVGTYLVTVIENATSLRSPTPLVKQFSFQVNESVAIEHTAWSTLKARFDAAPK